MRVTNTDASPALLHTEVLDLDENDDVLVIATPPVTRVEAGEEQLVRFIYQGQPLTTQRLKRVTFEGIGQPRTADGRAVIGLGVRQNLPLLLHPAGLPREREPWKYLQWQIESGMLVVRNDSAYVVRLTQNVILLPSGLPADLKRTYVLPGQSITVALPAGSVADTRVRLQPASVQGGALSAVDMSVQRMQLP